MYEERDDVRESAMLYDLLIDDVRRAVAERRAAVMTIERCQRGHHGRYLAHEMEEWWATQRREAEAFAELQVELRKAREAEHARRVQAQMVIGARVRGRMGRRLYYSLCDERTAQQRAWAACLKIQTREKLRKAQAFAMAAVEVLRRERRAAVLIEKHARGRKGRAIAAQRKRAAEKRKQAAVVLQATARAAATAAALGDARGGGSWWRSTRRR